MSFPLKLAPVQEILVLILLVCLSGVLIYTDSVGFLGTVLLPFAHLRSFSMTLTKLRYLEEENSILRRRLTEVSHENSILREQVNSALRLEKLLGFSTQATMPLRFARVLGYPDPRRKGGMVIDKGRESGIEENMTVICPKGLVGIVTGAGYGLSHVRLVNEPGYKVSALVSSSRSTGILNCLSDGSVVMEWVAPDAEVSIGDTVVTSGLGLVAPGGIPIGRVLSMINRPEKFSKTLFIKLFQDPRSLEEVAVILKRQAEYQPILDGVDIK
ncbi:MAG: rod shape-determining protein MreC [bacterium]